MDVRGGLDDALDKLARRDELRRRAAGEAAGTPPAVTELIEAIAAVVARHPELGVTVGVEGAGDPVLLQFHFADGQVQVTADNSVADRAANGRHADFDIDIEIGDPVEEPHPAASPVRPAGGEASRLSHDDQDRYGPPSYGPEPAYYAEPETAERPYPEAAERPYPETAERPYRETAERPYGTPPSPFPAGEVTVPLDPAARLRDTGMTEEPSQHQPVYPPHPFAATPPPPVPAQTTRRIGPEHLRAFADPAGTGPGPRRPPAGPPDRGMPAPLPRPIPLQVERPEETEMAARRLAALLRDDPSLLGESPDAP